MPPTPPLIRHKKAVARVRPWRVHTNREQLARPTFQKLGLAKKVRYLPYERVNEIGQFFGEEGSGLSVGVLLGKSDDLTAA